MVRRCECEGRKDMDLPDQTTHFGFRDVPLGDKQTLVNDVFHSVASRYDLMNDLMSAGLHRLLKEVIIKALNPPRSATPVAVVDDSYRYLVNWIGNFPKPAAFADMIRAAGFSRVGWQSLTGGIVALHSGWRL